MDKEITIRDIMPAGHPDLSWLGALARTLRTERFTGNVDIIFERGRVTLIHKRPEPDDEET